MDDIAIEQAVVSRSDAGEVRVMARSGGFRDEWQTEAELVCAGFGTRLGGTTCPPCVFARPFGRSHVAVVQAADLAPGLLGFRFLVLPRGFYTRWLADPFAVADRYPPPWHLRGELPGLAWPVEPPARRTVAQVQSVLQRTTGPEQTPQSPVLLGAAQALVDGGRVAFERPVPDTDLVRGLWMLLPHSARRGLWPASFAFGNALGFDVVVMPRATDDVAGYLTEEQAADYPEGRYELSLQTAAEAGDQAELDALFARRSRGEVFRLGLALLIGVVFLLVLAKLLSPPAPRRDSGVGNRRISARAVRQADRRQGWSVSSWARTNSMSRSHDSAGHGASARARSKSSTAAEASG
jgi:hypothetical protein